MSQSPLEAPGKAPGEATGEADAYHAAWTAISRLLERGFSWSGHERDVALSNRGGWAEGRGRFVDVSAPAGLYLDQDARAAAKVDWDLDGDLDLVVTSRTGPRVRVLRNEQRAGHHWLELRLVDEGANPDAIGARIEVTDEDGGLHVASRRAGEGFLAQSGSWVHVGLGDAGPAGLRVRWPDGAWETFEGARADRRLVLARGSGRARSWPAPSAAEPLAVGPLAAPAEEGGLRVPLRMPLALPSLEVFELDGTPRELAGVLPGNRGPATERALLLVLVSHTCAPCVGELTALAGRAAELREAGLEVVALAVDPAEERTELEAFVARTGFEGPLVRAGDEALARLDAVQSALTDQDRRMPVPAAFLLDRSGRLQVLYLGPVDPERLLADLRLAEVTGARRELASVPFPGRFLALPEREPADVLGWLEGALLRRGLSDAAEEVSLGRVEARQVEEAELQLEFGRARLRQGRWDAARQHFERATELDPTSGAAWAGLGYCLQRDEAWEAARDAYERSLSHGQADDENTRANLGLVYHALGDREGVERVRAWLAARESELLEEFEQRVGGG